MNHLVIFAVQPLVLYSGSKYSSQDTVAFGFAHLKKQHFLGVRVCVWGRGATAQCSLERANIYGWATYDILTAAIYTPETMQI